MVQELLLSSNRGQLQELKWQHQAMLVSDKVAGEECGGSETDVRLLKGWAEASYLEPQDRSSDCCCKASPARPQILSILLH